MRYRKGLAFACVHVALALYAGTAWADDHVVTANDDLTFSPANLFIVQGDTVTFQNGGGLHNVRADDNSFWCADDCSLHRSPSSNNWSDTVQFNSIRAIGYYCEQHGTAAAGSDPGSGMRGSITVRTNEIFAGSFEGS